MIAIWHWFTQTWNALALYIARDWPYYLIAMPVIAGIAWLTLPRFKPPFVDEQKDDSTYW